MPEIADLGVKRNEPPAANQYALHCQGLLQIQSSRPLAVKVYKLSHDDQRGAARQELPGGRCR